jgi:hypothetical protein
VANFVHDQSELSELPLDRTHEATEESMITLCEQVESGSVRLSNSGRDLPTDNIGFLNAILEASTNELHGHDNVLLIRQASDGDAAVREISSYVGQLEEVVEAVESARQIV